MPAVRIDQEDLTQSGVGSQPGRHRKEEGGGAGEETGGGEEGEGGEKGVNTADNNQHPFEDHSEDRGLSSPFPP